MTLLAGLAFAWLAAILTAPWLPVPAAGIVYLFGSRICHQLAERSFYLDGAQLPVCARCLGMYLGAAGALLAGLRFRPCALRTPARLPTHSSERVPRAEGLRRERTHRAYAGQVVRPRASLRYVVGAATLNVATWALELLGRWDPSNGVRAIAGTALGVAVGLALRDVVPAPAPAVGTVDYQRCTSQRRIRSAPPESLI